MDSPPAHSKNFIFSSVFLGYKLFSLSRVSCVLLENRIGVVRGEMCGENDAILFMKIISLLNYKYSNLNSQSRGFEFGDFVPMP